MAEKRHGISRDLIIHPGETIADMIETRDLTQKELAHRAGVSEAFLSDVIRGKKDISKSLALGLEYALDVPRSFWLNLQANYDAELLAAGEEEAVREEEKEVYGRLHEIVSFLKKKGLVASEAGTERKIIILRKILRVSDLTDLNKLVPAGAFRISGSSIVDPYVFGAWLCLCKRGDDCHLKTAYVPEKAGQLVTDIKKIMCEDLSDPQRPLHCLLSEYGINFSLMRNFRGAPVHGYIERKGNDTYRMILTLRGSFADIFWFSLFHELGHIVNGDLKSPYDYIDVHGESNDQREAAADRFAEDAMIDRDAYNDFACMHNGSIKLSDIEGFAGFQGVPPCIVIGRLQNDGIIPWETFAKYRTRYKWSES